EDARSVYGSLIQGTESRRADTMGTVYSMLEYMRTSSHWPLARPAHNIITPEQRRRPALPPPCAIPPEVLRQLDDLLHQAIADMQAGNQPMRESATFWNALCILRYTGMRFSDLAHLYMPDQRDQEGCLNQDSGDNWWIYVIVSKTRRSY